MGFLEPHMSGKEKFFRGTSLTLAVVFAVMIGALLLVDNGNKVAPDTGVGNPCGFICETNPQLICVANQCAPCTSSVECKFTRSNAFCSDAHICRHKHLFPYDSTDIITFIFLFIASAVASAGGVGGGGIIVALFVLISHFTAREAIPLSKVAAVGAAIFNLIYFGNMKHPVANRPRIDFDIAIMLEPMTLAGTGIGVIMNKTFPEVIIVSALFLVLGFTGWHTLKKGVQLWKMESVRAGDETQPLLISGYAVIPTRDEPLTDTEHLELQALLKSESQMFPPSRIFVLVGIWIFVFVVAIVRGGKHEGYVPCGSVAYWYLFFAIFLVCVVVTHLFGEHLLHIHQRKVALKYPFQPGDPLWTKRNVWMYPAVCVIAGVFSGMLGVSGALIQGPLLLEWGVLPQVQSATTSFMILFTSSCTASQFFFMGDLDGDYSCVILITGFAAAALGQTVIGMLVQKYKKTSLIVLCLAIVLLVSAVLIGVVGLDNAKGHADGFRPMCGA